MFNLEGGQGSESTRGELTIKKCLELADQEIKDMGLANATVEIEEDESSINVFIELSCRGQSAMFSILKKKRVAQFIDQLRKNVRRLQSLG